MREVYFHGGRRQVPNLASAALEYPDIKSLHVEHSLEFTPPTMTYACGHFYWNLSNCVELLFTDLEAALGGLANHRLVGPTQNSSHVD